MAVITAPGAPVPALLSCAETDLNLLPLPCCPRAIYRRWGCSRQAVERSVGDTRRPCWPPAWHPGRRVVRRFRIPVLPKTSVYRSRVVRRAPSRHPRFHRALPGAVAGRYCRRCSVAGEPFTSHRKEEGTRGVAGTNVTSHRSDRRRSNCVSRISFSPRAIVIGTADEEVRVVPRALAIKGAFSN